MRRPPPRTPWRHPAVLASAALLVASAVVLATAPQPVEGFAPRIATSPVPSPEPVEFEARLWSPGRDDLLAPSFATVRSGPAPAERVEAVLAELRARLVPEGAWPERLPVPAVFVTRDEEVVLDLRPSGPVPLEVAEEERLARSIAATLAELGYERVAFLRDGRATGVLLEHVAVRSSL